MLTLDASERKKMYADFNSTFEIGRKFQSKEEMKEVFNNFCSKYNVSFSIKSSHPALGEFNWKCVHSGFKRDTAGRSKQTPETQPNTAEEEFIETIDLTTGQEAINSSAVPKVNQPKKAFKKASLKCGCQASVNVYGLKVRSNHMKHNHPLSTDVTIYAVHRKQNPEIMQKIYAILSSGCKDPVTSVMDVS